MSPLIPIVTKSDGRPLGRLWIGALLVALAFAGSFLFRLSDMRDGVGARNLEASYHVLLTLEALDASPGSDHSYLPIVSLGRPQDKGLVWGLTVPSSKGDYFYTSFFATGFLLPYAALKSVDAPFTLRNLALFNGMLGLAGSLLFFLLAYRATEALTPGRSRNMLDSIIASAPMIFSKEALSSTGLIYWHQCIFQLVLIGMALSLLNLLTKADRQRSAVALLLFLAFLGPLLDYTAFLANAALTGLFWFKWPTGQSRKALAVGVATATIFAVSTTIAHFAIQIGGENFLTSLVGRFGPRTLSPEPLTMPIGYLLSYGSFLIVFAFAAWVSVQFLFARREESSVRAVICLLFFVVGACLENLLLFQHASQFTFDRFKFAIVIGLLTVIALQIMPLHKRLWLTGLVALSCLVGIAEYQVDRAHYSKWTLIYQRNLALRSQIDRKIDRSCALFATNYQVRGYTNTWLQRGVHEEVTPQEFEALASRTNPCGSVYLISRVFKPDFFEFTKAIVLTPTGQVFTLSPDGVTS